LLSLMMIDPKYLKCVTSRYTFPLISTVLVYTPCCLDLEVFMYFVFSTVEFTFAYHLCNSGAWLTQYSVRLRLDNRAIEVRSPAEAKDFSSNLCVQIGSEAHPASCTMGTGGPLAGGKARPGHNADHSPPSSAKVVNK
jgi:hypothetical protein